MTTTTRNYNVVATVATVVIVGVNITYMTDSILKRIVIPRIVPYACVGIAVLNLATKNTRRRKKKTSNKYVRSV